MYVATKNRYWSDKSQKGTVEIDVVVQSKRWGYLWGSLKRNPNDLAPQNFSPHLANVWQQLDDPAAVNHGLLFISTVLDADTRKRLMQASVEIGGKILARHLKKLKKALQSPTLNLRRGKRFKQNDKTRPNAERKNGVASNPTNQRAPFKNQTGANLNLRIFFLGVGLYLEN